ncbi:MAG: DNA/RNA helicase domain-containing protein, partial [Planctomycetota bacterium]
RRLTLEWERLELPQFSRGPKDETSRTDVKKPERRQYLKNTSLVLLTRARQGMVIFVPPGAKRDRTRSPAFYEGVSRYLTDLGVPQV